MSNISKAIRRARLGVIEEPERQDSPAAQAVRLAAYGAASGRLREREEQEAQAEQDLRLAAYGLATGRNPTGAPLSERETAEGYVSWYDKLGDVARDAEAAQGRGWQAPEDYASTWGGVKRSAGELAQEAGKYKTWWAGKAGAEGMSPEDLYNAITGIESGQKWLGNLGQSIDRQGEYYGQFGSAEEMADWQYKHSPEYLSRPTYQRLYSDWQAALAEAEKSGGANPEADRREREARAAVEEWNRRAEEAKTGQYRSPEEEREDRARSPLMEPLDYLGDVAANAYQNFNPLSGLAGAMEITGDALNGLLGIEKDPNYVSFNDAVRMTAAEQAPLSRNPEEWGDLGKAIINTAGAASNMAAQYAFWNMPFSAANAMGAQGALAPYAGYAPEMGLGGSAASNMASRLISTGAKIGMDVLKSPGNFGVALGSGTSSYAEARDNGANFSQALTNGMAKGLAEYFSNKLFSGTPFENASGEKGYVTKLTEYVAEKLGKEQRLIDFNKSTGGKLFNWLFDKAGEGLEEVVTGIADPWIDKITYDWDTDTATADELVEEFAGGVLLSLMLAPLDRFGNIRERDYNRRTGRVYKTGQTVTTITDVNGQAVTVPPVDEATAGLIESGLESPEGTESRELAETLLEKAKAGKTISAEETGRLAQANDAEIRAEASSESRVQSSEETEATQEEREAAQDKGILRSAQNDSEAQPLTAPMNTEEEQANARFDEAREIFVKQAKTGEEAGQVLASLYADTAAEHQSALSFAVGAVPYYYAGHAGKAFEDVRVNQSADITPEQARVAWNEGRIAAVREQAAAERAEREAAQKAEADAWRAHERERNAVLAEGERGFVVDDKTREVIGADNVRRIDTVARRLGQRAVMLPGAEMKTYNAQNRLITPDGALVGDDLVLLMQEADDGDNDVTGYLYKLYGHETGHQLKIRAPKQYADLRAALEAKLRDDIARKEAYYNNKNGMGYSREAIVDEAVNDYIGELFRGGTVLDEFLEENKDNRSLLQRLLDAVRRLVRKLRGMPEQEAAKSVEAKLVAALRAAEQATTGKDTESGEASYHFAGESAATADRAALSRAQGMEEQGQDAETIRQETGWFRGADGKWRFEIDDSGMSYRRQGDMRTMQDPEYREYLSLWDKVVLFGNATEEEAARLRELDVRFKSVIPTSAYKIANGEATLADVIQHDALFAAYPQLRDIRVQFSALPEGTNGQYSEKQNTIFLSEKLREAPQETLIHEIQHVIQQIEGFAKGASPEYWTEHPVLREDGKKRVEAARKNLERVEQKFRDIWPNDEINLNLAREYDRLTDQFFNDDDVDIASIQQQLSEIESAFEAIGMPELLDEYMDASGRLSLAETEAKMRSVPAQTLYLNTAGEIEARDAAARRGLTAEQRRTTRPNTGDENTVFAESGSEYHLREADADYMAAVERGDMEAAQRMVDEAARAAGYDSPKLYHGTYKQFNSFDPGLSSKANDYGSGIYLTNDLANARGYAGSDGIWNADLMANADSYAQEYADARFDQESDYSEWIKAYNSAWDQRAEEIESNGHVLSLFAKNVNPFVVSFDVSIPVSEATKIIQSIPGQEKAQINEWLRDMRAAVGRDGEITTYAFANQNYSAFLSDALKAVGYSGITDTTVNRKFNLPKGTEHIIIFNATDIKSADPVTYDADGNVIPLSERFNPADEDIRYHLREDSEGRELTEAQAAYFAESKAVDENGRLLVLYHGTTAYGEINKFRRGRSGWLGPGIYLTSRKADAQRYADAMGEGNGSLYELFANVKQPLVVTGSNPVPEILMAAYGRESVYKARSAKQSNDPQIITPADIKKLQAKGYDGIRWDFGRSTEISVFSPEQIKRTDNQNPTSDPDVRYHLREPDAATMEELTRENERLRKRVEYWKGQTKQTRGLHLRLGDLNRLTGQLVKDYAAVLDENESAELREAVARLARLMREDPKGLQYSELMAHAEDVARVLVQNASELVNDDEYQDYKDFKKWLRGQKITISRQDAGFIPDFTAWKKAHSAIRVGYDNGGLPIDTAYSELAGQFPGFFPESISNPTDQLERIAEVLDSMGPVYDNPYSADMAAAVEYATFDVLERIMDEDTVRPTPPTAADKAKEKQRRRYDIDVAFARREAELAGKEAVAKERAKGEAALAEEKARNKAAMEDADLLRRAEVEYTKERYEARLQKYRDTLKKVRERRDEELTRVRRAHKMQQQRQSAAKLRARIERHAKELYRELTRPTDKKHIPEALRSSVAKVLQAINMESGKEYAFIGGDYKLVQRGTELGAEPTKKTQLFAAMKEQLAKAENSGEATLDPNLLGFNGETGLLDEVIAMGDKPLADMSRDELQKVWDVLKQVEKAVKDWNKAFAAGRYATISEIAGALWGENAKKRDTLTLAGAAGRAQQLFNLDMLTPEAYFHRLGPTGDALFRALRRAQDNDTRLLDLAVQKAQEVIGDYDVRKAEQETVNVTLGGEEAEITRAQLMEIYVLLRREQALKHLEGGILPAATRKGVVQNKRAEPYRLNSIEELANACAKLTDEERRIAEALQRFVTVTAAEWGNAASLAVYGYRKFGGEEHYWPLDVNRQDVKSSIEGESGKSSLKNAGFTKPLTPNANNSIRVKSIFDTFAEHVCMMATFSTHLEIMEDLMRVLNYKQRNEEGLISWTTKGIMDRVFGNGGTSYLQTLLEQLSYGVKGETIGGDFMSATSGRYKGSAIGANLRVILQQPTAILRALDMIRPDYLAEGLGSWRRGWQRAQKYAPIAKWKSWGYFDVATGKSIKSLMFNSDSKLSKFNSALMAPAGLADAFAWGQLWSACEKELEAQIKKGSVPGIEPGTEAFYQRVAERFSEIVDRTQVVDGILQRSQIMRSPDRLVKMATSFMAEPTKQYNQFMSAVYDLRHSGGKKERRDAMKHLARTLLALLASFAANAAAQSLIDGLRDDDREKKYFERFLGAYPGNLLDNVNPLSFVPWARDVSSLIQGYSVDRMDMTTVSNIVNAVKGTTKALQGEGKKSVANALTTLAAEAARLFGLPVANIKRDVLAIVNTVATQTDNFLMQYEIDKVLYPVAANTSRYAGILWHAYQTDSEQYEILYKRMVADGIDEKKLKDAMEKRMEDAQGVTKAAELEQRYMNPEQQSRYDGLHKGMERSGLWRQASTEERERVEDKLYQLVAQTDTENSAGTKLQEKIDEAKEAGISEGEYMLYLLALSMADEPTDKGTYGSYTNDEQEAALDMLDGLSREDKSWLWMSTHDSDKNNPYK